MKNLTFRDLMALALLSLCFLAWLCNNRKRGCIIALLLVTGSLAAQVTATTQGGEKVTLYPNKTWEYQKGGAVDCQAFIKTYPDPMAGAEQRGFANMVSIADINQALQLFALEASPGKWALMIYVYEGGKKQCVPENAKAKFLFSDDSKAELTALERFNCEWRFYTELTNKQGAELEAFAGKRCKAIQVNIVDKTIYLNVPNEQAVTLKNSFACLIGQ